MSTTLTAEPVSIPRPPYPAQVKKFSYRDLRGFHLANLERQLTDDGKSLQGVDNHGSAINTWLEHLGSDIDAEIGEEFGAEFDRHLGSYLKQLEKEGKAKQTRKDRKSILGKWRESYHLLLRSGGPTESFGAALKRLLETRNVSVSQVARECGIERKTLEKWLKGSGLPAARSIGGVAALEKFFDLQPGTLVAKLPAFLSGVQQEVVGRNRTPFRKNQSELQGKRYALTGLEGRPAEEWRSVVRFYTDSAWVAAQGLVRNGRGWSTRKGRNRYSSVGQKLGYVRDFLGFLCLPPDADDPQMAGKGFREDELSLSLFTRVDLVYDFLQFRKARTVNKIYNRYTESFLSFCSQLVRPKTGFLWQHPAFGRRLAEAIRKNEGWQRHCAEAHERLGNIRRNIKQNEGFGRSNDNINVVKPLIRERQHPITVMLDIAEGIRAEIGKTVDSMRRAVLFRDLLLFDFLVSNPVRVLNISEMKYAPGSGGDEGDETNLYRKPDGSWHLKYEVPELKNGYYRGRYDLPVHPSMWPDVEEYLNVHRPLLAGAGQCDYVLRPSPRSLNKLKRPVLSTAPINSGYLSQRVFLHSQLYVPGCVGFGAHAARHFAATEWLKNNPGAYAVAAALLHDSEEMVISTYSWVEPKDMILFWNGYLGNVVEEARKGRGDLITV